MSRFGRRLIGAALALAMLTLGLAMPMAFAADETDSGPKVLRIGVPNDLTTANPLSLRSGSDWNVATTQYDMMLMFGNDDLSPSPGLAKECVPNDDLTEWTCTFRDDVKWSDGEPFTSKDVAFTYQLMIDQGISIYNSYFSAGPTFETPRRHHVDLEESRANLRSADSAVGLHTPRAHLEQRRRSRQARAQGA